MNRHKIRSSRASPVVTVGPHASNELYAGAAPAAAAEFSTQHIRPAGHQALPEGFLQYATAYKGPANGNALNSPDSGIGADGGQSASAPVVAHGAALVGVVGGDPAHSPPGQQPHAPFDAYTPHADILGDIGAGIIGSGGSAGSPGAAASHRR